MDVIHDAILKILAKYHSVNERLLGEYFNVSHEVLAKALSELVMTNQIKRYEYMINNESTRRAFYMVGSSKLML